MFTVRRILFTLLSVLLVGAIALSAAAAAASARRPVAEPRKAPTTQQRTSGHKRASHLLASNRIFGISLAPTSELSVVPSLSRQLSHHLGIINIYSGFNSPFPAAPVAKIRSLGAIPEVTWEPWVYALGPKQDTYPLTAIASGRFDHYIKTWEHAAENSGGPILIRFAHEMNGNWYPWDVGVNGNTAADFVRAFRHVHQAVANASNLLWIWSPNVLFPNSSSLASMYPGNAYVDYIGIDGYNFGPDLPHGHWLTPAQIFGPTLAQLKRFAPSKPVLIAETASTTEGGSKPEWIHQFFNYLETQPRIVGFAWTEFKSRGDWPLQSSASCVKAMKAGLAAWSASA